MTDPLPDASAKPPSWREALPRLALRLVSLIVMVAVAHYLINFALDWTETLPEQTGARAQVLILLAIFSVYALMIALPFVPGIEIAFALLMLRGAAFAPPIYIATLAGLALAFFAGRLLSIRVLERIFLDLHLVKAAALVRQMGPLDTQQRVRALHRALPRKYARLALQYRYLGLAALINMPGSGLIGGGGGICLMAGMSGVFTARATIPTLALAILPFPLFLWLTESGGILPWLPG